MSKLLSLSDLKKLPFCKYDLIAKCDVEKKSPDLKRCLLCMCDGLFKAIDTENLGRAMHFLDMMVIVFKEADMLPKEEATKKA